MPRVDDASTGLLADWVLFQRLPYVLNIRDPATARQLTLQLTLHRDLLQRFSRRAAFEIYHRWMQHPKLHLDDLRRCGQQAQEDLARELQAKNTEAVHPIRWRIGNNWLLTKLAEHIAMSVLEQARPPQRDRGGGRIAGRPYDPSRPPRPPQPAQVPAPRQIPPHGRLRRGPSEEGRRAVEGAQAAQENSPPPQTPQAPLASSQAAAPAPSRHESRRSDSNDRAGADPPADPKPANDRDHVDQLLEESWSARVPVSPNFHPVDHVDKLNAPPPDFASQLHRRKIPQRPPGSSGSKQVHYVDDLLQQSAPTQEPDDEEDEA